MSSFPTEGAALKKIVEKSKSREIAFGYNPGTDEDDHYFAAHLKKTPEVLGKLARNEGLGAKIAFGTFTTKGNLVSLRCSKVVPMLAKLFKRLLRQNKIGLNVQILDQDGNLLDADIEDLPAEDLPAEDQTEDWSAGEDAAEGDEDEDEEEARAGDSAADDGAIAAAEAAVPDADIAPDSAEDLRRMQALVARVKAVQPRLAAAPPAMAGTLAGAMKGALTALRAGDYGRSEQTVSQIEAILAKLPAASGAEGATVADAPAAQPASDPRLPKLREAAQGLLAQIAALPGALAEPMEAQLETVLVRIEAAEAEAALGMLRQVQEVLRPALEAKAKWDKAFALVDPQVTAALSAAAGGGQDLRVKWNFATGLAAEGQYDRALVSLGAVATLLRQGPAATADAPPAGVVAFQRSRVLWLGARSKMMDEARKLGDRIAASGADDEDAAEIAAAGREIVAQVERIDERLQTVLDDLTNSPEGRARETLKRQAAAVVSEYEAMLGAAPFTMIDQNPFEPVSVAARARVALTAISRSLA
ncbi:hypothetical protein [Szabonella alba]|uniref:Uncharacterized protein n=1 Tax=Szabonella alba TaxID=2804194 RepID=A0A8K0V5G5_9RHOB|nr:hypothetical protein [Szabonella alba]MBL4915787.1 hypothetical protein [Szabonella alba]